MEPNEYAEVVLFGGPDHGVTYRSGNSEIVLFGDDAEHPDRFFAGHSDEEEPYRVPDEDDRDMAWVPYLPEELPKLRKANGYGQPLAAVVRWTMVNGEAVVTSFEVHSMDGSPITAQTMRVPTAKLIETARWNAYERAGADAFAAESGAFFAKKHGDADAAKRLLKQAKAYEETGEDVAPKRGRGRPAQFDRAHFEYVAELCRIQIEDYGNRTRYRQAVAKILALEMNDPQLANPKDTRVRGWIDHAADELKLFEKPNKRKKDQDGKK